MTSPGFSLSLVRRNYRSQVSRLRRNREIEKVDVAHTSGVTSRASVRRLRSLTQRPEQSKLTRPLDIENEAWSNAGTLEE